MQLIAISCKMEKCQCQTGKQEPCKRRSTVIYNGQHVCKIHLRQIKRNECCPICMDDMDGKERIDPCGFGHYFHKKCLQMCHQPAVCPTCSRPYLVSAAMKVYEDLDRLRRMEVYSLPSATIKELNRVDDILLQAAYYLSREEITVIGYLIKTVMKKKEAIRNDLIDIFHQLLLKSAEMETIEGVTFTFSNGKLEIVPYIRE